MFITRLLPSLGLLILLACDQESGSVKSMATPPRAHLEWESYQSSAQEILVTTLQSTDQLAESVTDFLRIPSEANQILSRDLWLALHTNFSHLMFYHHDSLFSPTGRELLGRIDAWPIEPGYLDALPDYPNSGIINDITVPLNASSLANQHGLTALEDVSLGLHALEFLLYQPTQGFVAQHELSDLQKADQLSISQLSSNRRRKALALVTAILVADLHQLDLQITSVGNTSAPIVTDTLSWCFTYLSKILIRQQDAGFSQHGSFSQYALRETRILSSLLLQTYARDSNSREVLQGVNRTTEQQFFDTLQKLDAQSRAVDELAGPHLEERIAQVKLLRSLLEELSE